LAITVDIHDEKLMSQLVQSTIGTKFSSRWNDIMVQLALQAVLTVANLNSDHATSSSSTTTTITTTTTAGLPGFVSPTHALSEVDLKRYAKVEKIPGGELSDCQVVRGVMFNKEPTHSQMRRRIEHPRILLLDSPLEYKKGESNTHVEITDDQDWNTLLKMEEEYVENMCMEIIAHHPDVVITEKGVSDLAQHYLQKANITAFRRLRKTDNNRIARAVGATIVSRPSEIQESDIGTACGVMEMRQVGDEWFCFLDECDHPKACSIVLRGGSKDVLNEIERNLQDALQVVRNVVYQPKLLPGGGATEMAVAVGLRQVADQQAQGLLHGPFLSVAQAMEVIPRTLAENCGVSVLRTVTALRAKHAAAFATSSISTSSSTEAASADDAAAAATPTAAADGLCYWGINGVTGELVDMKEYGIWEPLSVKVQTIKTAIESACMIL
jgi:T-complex protein 1 subunit gamma